MVRDGRWTKGFARLCGGAALVPLLSLCLCDAAGAASPLVQRPLAPDPTERPNEEKRTTRPDPGKPPRRRRPKPPAQDAPLEVTFLTNAGGAELTLSRGDTPPRRLGVTDARGAFTLKLTPGAYEVTATRQGYGPQRQRVDVRAGNTTFKFELAERPRPPEPPLRPRAVLTADEVMRRYVDPAQTDRVTAEDWELVRKHAGEAFDANLADLRSRAQELFAEGQLALLRGRHPEAFVAFRSAAQTLPGSALAYYGLGRTYLATNQTEQAARAFARAVELNEEMAMAHAGLFEALTLLGRDREARPFFERARALKYDPAKLSFLNARGLMRRGLWAEALEELRAAARTWEAAEVNVAIGDCYVGLKQISAAGPAYERAIRLDPNSAVAHARFGEVRLRQRDYPAAHAALERALQLDPAGVGINRERVAKLAREAATRMRKMK